MAQKTGDMEQRAKEFLTAQVTTPQDAIDGAKNIIAEWVNEDQMVREGIRTLLRVRPLFEQKL